MEGFNISGVDVIFVPIITALAQIIRMTKTPERYIPLIEIALGIVAGVFYLGDGVKIGILEGIWLGLASTGLLNGYKITMQNKENLK